MAVAAPETDEPFTDVGCPCLPADSDAPCGRGPGGGGTAATEKKEKKKTECRTAGTVRFAPKPNRAQVKKKNENKVKYGSTQNKVTYPPLIKKKKISTPDPWNVRVSEKYVCVYSVILMNV